MYLVQVLLPLEDNEHEPLPAERFQTVREELTKKFEGLTVYSQSPAEGLWKQGEEETTRDKIVVFEVMVDSLDRSWWKSYRQTLEVRFRQETIVIRAQEITIL